MWPAYLANHDFMSFFEQPAWAVDSLYREYPRLPWVSVQEPSERTKAVCQRCLVWEECLALALGDELLLGIWGGTSEAERRAMRASRGGTTDRRMASSGVGSLPRSRTQRRRVGPVLTRMRRSRGTHRGPVD